MPVSPQRKEMKIESLLRLDCILDNLQATSKEDALRQMAQTLFDLGYVRKSFLQAILDRESRYPSGLPMEGEKIAIPHVDSIHVVRSVLFFARLGKAVEFSVMGDPASRISVRLISMFALKEKNQIGNLLTTLITAYQNPLLLDSLIRAEDKATIYKILANTAAYTTAASQ